MAARQPLTDAQLMMIRSMRLAGATIKQIAKAAGTTRHKVATAIKLAGIPTNPAAIATRNLTDAQLTTIRKLRLAGASTRKIAATVGLSRKKVSTVVQCDGIGATNGTGPKGITAPLSDAQRATIRTMHLAGASIDEIAQAVGISRWSVRTTPEAHAPKEIPEPAAPRIVPENYPPRVREVLETAVAEILPSNNKLVNRLESVGILFVADLLRWTREELLLVPGIKGFSMKQILDALGTLGLSPQQQKTGDAA